MSWNILKILLLLLALFYGAPLHAKEQALLGGVSGIYVPSSEPAPPLHWRAEWVWDKGKKTELALFRKGFVLSKKPKYAILHITASSQYKLYINGEYIRKGPARSAPHHQSFDNFDIAPLLKRGENVIAVEVHFRPEVVSYQFPARAGLIAQLHLPGLRIHSDKSWKVLAAPHWSARSPKMARFHQQVADRVDMGRFPHGWQSIGFDDGAWEGAVPLLRNAGWPSAQKNARAVSLTPPWTALIPRSYPYLEERDKRADGLIAGYEIGEYFLPFPRNHARDVLRLRREIAPALGKQLRSYKRGSAPLILPQNGEGKLWLLVFDMGRIVNGMPFFDMEGERGVQAEVVAMPFMVEDRLSYHMVDSDFLDAVTLSGKQDVWQAQYFKPARFLALIVKSGSKATELRHFGVRELAYPFRLRGGMESRTEGFIAEYMA
ncbi:MAG: alpha-L-rhamnosidase N-terminal domain-containing protein, partial [Parvibaculales bacterium]